MWEPVLLIRDHSAGVVLERSGTEPGNGTSCIIQRLSLITEMLLYCNSQLNSWSLCSSVSSWGRFYIQHA